MEQLLGSTPKFCESINVAEQSFYYWKRKLNSSSKQNMPSGPFVSVQLPTPTVEFELPGGVVARVDNETEALRPLVQLLLEQGGAS